MDNIPSNPNINAYTMAQNPNSSYLLYKTNMVINQPMDGSTLGLMMLVTTLQWQPTLTGPTYSNAASQAGKAAFIMSGGQGAQDKVTNIVTKNATNAIHSIGITDTEVGVILGAAKIARDRRIDINGPRIFGGKSHLTLNQNSGSLGIGWEFK